MAETTKQGDETTILIPPNGIFLGTTETDMIALEREGWTAGEPPPPEMNSG
jgi:hypothetical protein